MFARGAGKVCVRISRRTLKAPPFNMRGKCMHIQCRKKRGLVQAHDASKNHVYTLYGAPIAPIRPHGVLREAKAPISRPTFVCIYTRCVWHAPNRDVGVPTHSVSYAWITHSRGHILFGPKIQSSIYNGEWLLKTTVPRVQCNV